MPFGLQMNWRSDCGPARPAADRIGRRSILASAAAGVVGGAFGRSAVAADLVVGFIYLGAKSDFGYNHSHALGAEQIAALPGVRVVEQEKVAETSAAASAMEAMIVQEGARLIFATSFGYFDPYAIELAGRYRQVSFQHCGGVWDADRHPANLGSYFVRMHEAQYLAGVVAGSVADQIGFVASNRYPGVLRNINAFALGAQQANPQAVVRVVFTGSWSDPVREAETVNVLADQGVQAVGCSVDSALTVVQTAAARGLPACGYNVSLAELDFANYLVSAVSDWGPIVVPMAQQVMAGQPLGNSYVGGFREGVVKLGQYGAAAGPRSRELADAQAKQLASGAKWIWSGPLADNEGNQVLGAGERFEHRDLRLRKMDWFVEGVQA